MGGDKGRGRCWWLLEETLQFMYTFSHFKVAGPISLGVRGG